MKPLFPLLFLLPALLLTSCKSTEGTGKTVPQQLEERCREKDMGACNDLGYVYENALGIPKDVKKAFGLYEEACAGGHPGACNNLGRFYAYGTAHIVPVNLNKSLELFEKSCALGEKPACNNRDIILLSTKGRGAPKR